MGKPQTWVWIYFYIVGMPQLSGLLQPTTAGWVIYSQQVSTHHSFGGCKPKIKASAAPVTGGSCSADGAISLHLRRVGRTSQCPEVTFVASQGHLLITTLLIKGQNMQAEHWVLYWSEMAYLPITQLYKSLNPMSQVHRSHNLKTLTWTTESALTCGFNVCDKHSIGADCQSTHSGVSC